MYVQNESCIYLYVKKNIENVGIGVSCITVSGCRGVAVWGATRGQRCSCTWLQSHRGVRLAPDSIACTTQRPSTTRCASGPAGATLRLRLPHRFATGRIWGFGPGWWGLGFVISALRRRRGEGDQRRRRWWRGFGGGGALAPTLLAPPSAALRLPPPHGLSATGRIGLGVLGAADF